MCFSGFSKRNCWKNQYSFNRHMSEEEARAIIESQASRKERLAAADDVISNVGTIDDLTEAVAELDAKYLAMARAKKA